MEKNLNLKDLKRGDIVVLRDGQRLKLQKQAQESGSYQVALKFYFSSSWQTYWHSGRVTTSSESDLDIVDVIPKPFDWSEVPWGAAFRHSDDRTSTYYYIGKSVNKPFCRIFQTNEGTTHHFREVDMTRLCTILDITN